MLHGRNSLFPGPYSIFQRLAEFRCLPNYIAFNGWQTLAELTGPHRQRREPVCRSPGRFSETQAPQGARKKQPPRSPSPARLMNCRPLGINSLSPSMRRPVDKAPAPKLVTIWTKQCLAYKVCSLAGEHSCIPSLGLLPLAPISRFQFLLNGVA
jgi:hypothetical protein